jgi:hypothetical protein
MVEKERSQEIPELHSVPSAFTVDGSTHLPSPIFGQFSDHGLFNLVSEM